MSNHWLNIPLEDYEGHMSHKNVQQLDALAALFKNALAICRPENISIVGIAGGNGIDQIDHETTKRIVGLDINPQYLNEVRRRFRHLSTLELDCLDLQTERASSSPTTLVHAALIFEHTGLEPALSNVLPLVEKDGKFSVVLQLPSQLEQDVSLTGFSSLQTLKQDFRLIDPDEFTQLMTQNDFHLFQKSCHSLPAGKALWWGLFERH